MLDRTVINGPRTPPPGSEFERQEASLPRASEAAGINTLVVPAFNWVFGCSSVSGAMIAAYYDRTGYPSMYLGPTNGGLMPLDNSSWPTWSDGHETYPSCPLIASKAGVDGRVPRGSIDDYWIQYNSAANDPYVHRFVDPARLGHGDRRLHEDQSVLLWKHGRVDLLL